MTPRDALENWLSDQSDWTNITHAFLEKTALAVQQVCVTAAEEEEIRLERDLARALHKHSVYEKHQRPDEREHAMRVITIFWYNFSSSQRTRF